MLADSDKVDIRRYAGYPMYGGQPVQAFGYRFFTQYGTLEFRMNNALPEEYSVVQAMLTRLRGLEADLFGSSANLDTASAGPWVHNAKEVADRMGLYALHRRELCNFFGVPPGPSFQGGNSYRGVV